MIRNAPAFFDGTAWVVPHCPYCGERHKHGPFPAGTSAHAYPRTRVCHCLGTKFLGCEYRLIDGGDPLAEQHMGASS